MNRGPGGPCATSMRAADGSAAAGAAADRLIATPAEPQTPAKLAGPRSPAQPPTTLRVVPRFSTLQVVRLRRPASRGSHLIDDAPTSWPASLSQALGTSGLATSNSTAAHVRPGLR